MKNVMIALGLLVTVSGCANQILSDDRLRSNTAMALGQPDSTVVITSRRYDGMTNTYYTARTPHGSYNCTINGGTLATMGMTNPPQCVQAR